MKGWWDLFGLVKMRRRAWRARMLAALAQMEAGGNPPREVPNYYRPAEVYNHKIKATYGSLLTQEENERWETALRRLTARNTYPQELEWLMGAILKYRGAESLDTQIDALVDLVIHFQSANELNLAALEEEVGLTLQEGRQLLARKVQLRYKELVAHREDSETFYQLQGLMARSRIQHPYGYSLSDLYKAGIKNLPYTKDWNDLTARHHDTPSYRQFVGLGDMGRRDILLLGAQALEEDSLTKAQIVLAYCQVERYRQHVGDVLTASLARLVARHKAALASSSTEK